MPTAEELILRLSNVASVAQALAGRSITRESFGSGRELEEIGLLTMRLAAIEESIALFCEILLIRPELNGFHAPNKSVLTRQLAEKLSLYKTLTMASGILFGICTESIENSIVAMRALGEDRNTIIHGQLSRGSDGEPFFRSRGRDIPATLDELRRLTTRCEEAAFDFTNSFFNFYTELVRRKSSHSSLEEAMEHTLRTWFALHTSSKTFREIAVKERDDRLPDDPCEPKFR